ncbi:MAG: RsfA family transcriptional regulator [Alicyclobacillus sp.]|nr:RsfA family transcriptional regulator [Alicyclobacillus sp.]
MQSVEKWSTRSDAWTPADDERLAEIVLQHIRTGSTQLKAFDEAANELGRTPAACGYRWNGVLRKDRRDAVEEAKQVRKAAQRNHAKSGGSRDGAAAVRPMGSIQAVIQFLQSYEQQVQALRDQLQQLQSERDALQSRLQALESAAPPAGSGAFLTPEQLEHDSKTLFAIMERARRMLETDKSKAE